MNPSHTLADYKREKPQSSLSAIKRIVVSPFSHGTPAFFAWTNTYARLLQKKYFVNDYVFKSRYKKIDYQQEFQQELTFVLPFAYWHYLNGTLEKTISCNYTKELYFFSPDHEERYQERSIERMNFDIPNVYHCKTLHADKWAQVPLKAQYKNDIFVFKKPLLIIANKYNTEWKNEPINFFSIPMLDKMLARLSKKYQVVYNRPNEQSIITDNSTILELNEVDFIRSNYPDVILADELYKQHSEVVNNFNHFQLMLYANCEHFVSVHGGTAALASYFGGKNVIFSRCGHEHLYDEFNKLFPLLSGAKILHAMDENEVLAFINKHY